MTNVQKENGFTPIANELIEVVMQQKLNGTQFKIIMAIWRFTYGYQRKEHEMSLTFIAKATGVHKQTVKAELEKLIERNIVLVKKESTYSSSRIISFNKDYSTWEDLQLVNSLTVSKNTNSRVSESTDSRVSESTDSRVSEKTYTTVSESTYQERKYKEKKETTNSSENPFSFYMQNFGTISPFISESISQWCDELSDELVLEAMKLSIKQNKRLFRYTEGILRKWKNQNIKSLEDVQALEGERQRSIPTKKDTVSSQKETLYQRKTEIEGMLELPDDYYEMSGIEIDREALQRELAEIEQQF